MVCPLQEEQGGVEEDGAPGKVEEETSGTCWTSAPPTASALPPPAPPAPPAPPRGLWMQHCPENSRQIFSTASRTTWSLNWRDEGGVGERERERKEEDNTAHCCLLLLHVFGAHSSLHVPVSPSSWKTPSGCSYLLHVRGEPGWRSLVFFFGPLHFFQDHLINRRREYSLSKTRRSTSFSHLCQCKGPYRLNSNQLFYPHQQKEQCNVCVDFYVTAIIFHIILMAMSTVTSATHLPCYKAGEIQSWWTPGRGKGKILNVKMWVVSLWFLFHHSGLCLIDEAPSSSQEPVKSTDWKYLTPLCTQKFTSLKCLAGAEPQNRPTSVNIDAVTLRERSRTKDEEVIFCAWPRPVSLFHALSLRQNELLWFSLCQFCYPRQNLHKSLCLSCDTGLRWAIQYQSRDLPHTVTVLCFPEN